MTEPDDAADLALVRRLFAADDLPSRQQLDDDPNTSDAAIARRLFTTPEPDTAA